jgi:hypothetical protein
VSWDVKGKGLGVFKVLKQASSVPMGNFSDAELAFTRLFMRQYTEEKRMRDKITQSFGKDAVPEHFPELVGPDIDFHFIEVDFERVPDETERDYLNTIPTAFKLKREQVDTLRKAAGQILDANTDFQRLLTEMK